VLGSVRGGFIACWRGASDKPIAQAPQGDVCAITEGIEDALTIALHCPEWRVIAAYSVGNMGEIALPAALSELRLCLDRDGEKPQPMAAVRHAIRRYQDEGRTVFITRPGEGFKDFNAEHQAHWCPPTQQRIT